MNENKYPLTESTVTDRVSNLGRCILQEQKVVYSAGDVRVIYNYHGF
jgi:hypothetical protein